MTNQPMHEDKTPVSAGMSGSSRSSAESRASREVGASAGSVPHLCHQFANTLHSMLIQIRCAEMANEVGDAAVIREHLAQIEQAVDQSQQMLQDLRRRFANQPEEEPPP